MLPSRENAKTNVFFKLDFIDTTRTTPKINVKVSKGKDLFGDLKNVLKQASNEFSEELLKAF
ncbi:hypothetical protein NHP22001_12960 [Helicobacter sp. NHP22-001]|nr:hypothetical protein NHP22001_12960 [Helicobacter sp. NHP22-001]